MAAREAKPRRTPADDGRPQGPRPGRAASLPACPRSVVRELELDLDAFEGPFDLLLTLVLREELRAARGRRGGDRARVRRAPRRAGRARPRGVRRVPRPGGGAARAEGARAVPGRGGRARATSTRRRPPRSWRGGSPSTGGQGGRGVARRAARRRSATASSGSGRRRSRRAAEPQLAPQEPGGSPGAARCSPPSRRRCRSRTWRCAFRRSTQFLERLRALLARRRGSTSTGGRGALARRAGGRVPRAARAAKQGEVTLEQAAPFAPIRVARPASVERRTRGTSAPPDPVQPASTGSRARSRRCSSSHRSRCRWTTRRRRPRTTPSASRRRSSCSASVPRGPERDRARAGRRRLGLPRLARGGRGVRAPVRAAGRARPVAGGARDAGGGRLPRPVLAAEIAHLRGVNVDWVVAGLVERGLIAEAGRRSSAPCATGRRRCSSASSGSSPRRAAAPGRRRRRRDEIRGAARGGRRAPPRLGADRADVLSDDPVQPPAAGCFPTGLRLTGKGRPGARIQTQAESPLRRTKSHLRSAVRLPADLSETCRRGRVLLVPGAEDERHDQSCQETGT